MLKKTVPFKDLDGNDVVEDFYFKLSKAEMAEMEYEQKGGMMAYLDMIVKKDDRGAIIHAIKMILLKSVGKRSEDGRRFLKPENVVEDFLFSNAYEVVFMELLTDAAKAVEFVNGIMPSDLVEKVNAQNIVVDLPQSPISVTPNLNTPTPDFTRMTQADFADWQRRQSNPLGV